MAVAVYLAGSITPTLNVQHQLGTIQAAGVYVFLVDSSNMQNGDEMELRVTDKVTGGTIGAMFYGSYSHQQGTQIKISPPFPVANAGLTMVTLRQYAGTPRLFPFELRSI